MVGTRKFSSEIGSEELEIEKIELGFLGLIILVEGKNEILEKRKIGEGM